MISIPYGAIKRLALMDVIGYLARFQFLMVRLKETSTINIFCLYQISIPYGAIKRHMWRSHYHCVCEISIPYGAIKSIFVKK